MNLSMISIQYQQSSNFKSSDIKIYFVNEESIILPVVWLLVGSVNFWGHDPNIFLINLNNDA